MRLDFLWFITFVLIEYTASEGFFESFSQEEKSATPAVLHTYWVAVHGTPLVFHWCSIGTPSYSSGISLKLQNFFWGVLRWYSRFFLEYQWSTSEVLSEYRWSTVGVRTPGVALFPLGFFYLHPLKNLSPFAFLYYHTLHQIYYWVEIWHER